MNRYLTFCMILISCSNHYVRQPSKSDIHDVTPECEEVVRLVNENWFKHRNSPFHKDFPLSFTLAHHCKKCFINLHKADVIMILGEPDISEPNEFRYVLKKFYKGIKSQDYSSIIFRFTSNSVSDVEYAEHSAIE